jgi:hypothetical protein
MLSHEIKAWSRQAAPDAVKAVAEVAIDAMNAWPIRMCGNRELVDLAPWCPSLRGQSARWSQAAALAAAEMAIVCSVWPEPLNEALARPDRTLRHSGRR